MKVWSEHPEEFKAWQDRVRAERRAILKEAEENEWMTELELPAVPNKYTAISLTHEEWRQLINGQ